MPKRNLIRKSLKSVNAYFNYVLSVHPAPGTYIRPELSEGYELFLFPLRQILALDLYLWNKASLPKLQNPLHYFA